MLIYLVCYELIYSLKILLVLIELANTIEPLGWLQQIGSSIADFTVGVR